MISHVDIRELEERDSHKWDALIERSPQSTLFHKFDWLKIMEKYTNTKLSLLVGLDNEEIFAAIPLFIKKSLKGLITKVFSPPYPTQVPYLGPVFTGANEWKEMLRESRLRIFQQELDRYIESRIKSNMTLIVTSPGLVDVRPYLTMGYDVLPKFTYVCDISRKGEVFRGFTQTLRTDIAKAEKRGIQIEEAGLKEFRFTIGELRALLNKKEKWLEVSDEYFSEIYEKFHPNNLKVFVSKYDNKNLSGLILLMDKNKVWIWIGLARVEMKGIYPNELLQWRAIEWASDHGYQLCEIIDAQTSTSFKAKYNFNLDIFYSTRKYTKKYEWISSIHNIMTRS